MALISGSIYLDILVFLATGAAVIVAYMKWSMTYWRRRNVFTLPPSVPFGTAHNLMKQKTALGVEMKDLYDLIKSKNLKYGGYYFFTRPIFVPTDLDLVKNIMTKDFQHFTDHVTYVNEETEPITGHLFSLKGAKWRNLRVKLTPTFTSGKMKMMFQTLVDCSKDLPAVIQDEVKQTGTVDFKEIFARFTTDIIGSCAFGLDCNSLKNPDSKFREIGRRFMETESLWMGLVRLISMTIPEILGYFKIKVIQEDVTDFFTNVVKETVSYRERENVIRKDFMHLLIQLKNNVKIRDSDLGELKNTSGVVGKESFSMDELIAQAFIFYTAGFETSSTTSTFCMYELAQNQELQDKVRREIDTVLAKHDGKITYEAMMEMTYMDKVINETLRKYPPVPVHTRECTETYRVPDSDLTIEKGTFVFIPVLGIQRDPEVYPDPEKFDPERFSEENKANRHSSAWTPFGDGPRLCIGLRFGMLQTKVGLTVLLKNYKFTLNKKMRIPLEIDPKVPIILTSKNNVLLDAQKLAV